MKPPQHTTPPTEKRRTGVFLHKSMRVDNRRRSLRDKKGMDEDQGRCKNKCLSPRSKLWQDKRLDPPYVYKHIYTHKEESGVDPVENKGKC